MMVNEFYELVFIDSFWAAFTVSMESELVVYAMLAFASHPPLVILPLAFAGSMLGLTLNWLMGWLAVSTAIALNLGGETPAFINFCQNARRYGKWLLLINWLVPFGSPITLLAGIVRIHPLVFFSLTGLSRAAFYVAAYYMYKP